MDPLIGAYQKAIDKFYSLSAPKLAFDLHVKEIGLLGAKKTILEKMKDYQTDPLTALLAAQEMEKVDAEFSNLKDEVNAFILKHNLNA